jgi:hypothetical protein
MLPTPLHEGADVPEAIAEVESEDSLQLPYGSQARERTAMKSPPLHCSVPSKQRKSLLPCQ